MNSVDLEVGKLRTSENIIKLLVVHTVTNRQLIATSLHTFIDSLSISSEIPW